MHVMAAQTHTESPSSGNHSVMALEERTLVIRNIDSNVSRDLLFELFNQAGPVVNVVLRTDFAFIEFEHKVSVGYSLALMEGIHLFGRQLRLEPRVRDDQTVYKYVKDMFDFNRVMEQNPDYFLQFMPNTEQRDVRSDQWHQRRQSYPQRREYSSHRNRHSNDFRDFR